MNLRAAIESLPPAASPFLCAAAVIAHSLFATFVCLLQGQGRKRERGGAKGNWEISRVKEMYVDTRADMREMEGLIFWRFLRIFWRILEDF